MKVPRWVLPVVLTAALLVLGWMIRADQIAAACNERQDEESKDARSLLMETRQDVKDIREDVKELLQRIPRKP